VIAPHTQGWCNNKGTTFGSTLAHINPTGCVLSHNNQQQVVCLVVVFGFRFSVCFCFFFFFASLVVTDAALLLLLLDPLVKRGQETVALRELASCAALILKVWNSVCVCVCVCV
jgi:hypothetical protein